MIKKEPLRMCLACRQMKDKKELLRIVKNKDSEIFIDKTGKSNGRGAYICKDKECLAKLKKQKLLNKNFKCNVDEQIYKDIEEEIVGKSN